MNIILTKRKWRADSGQQQIERKEAADLEAAREAPGPASRGPAASVEDAFRPDGSPCP